MKSLFFIALTLPCFTTLGGMVTRRYSHTPDFRALPTQRWSTVTSRWGLQSKEASSTRRRVSKVLFWLVRLVGITGGIEFYLKTVQAYHLCLHYLIGRKLADAIPPRRGWEVVVTCLYPVLVLLVVGFHCGSVVAQVLSTRTVTLDRLDLKVANCRMAWLINLLTRLFASTISTYVCRALQQQLDGHASDLLGAMNGENMTTRGI